MTEDTPRRLIYYGRDIYFRSATLFPVLVEENGPRADWGAVEYWIREGETVTIRPATETEMANAEQAVREMKQS